ncbi:MAG: sensor histidine kinase, partial [Bacteroidota bacterium]
QLAQKELALVKAEKQRYQLMLGGLLLTSIAAGFYLSLRNRLHLQRSEAEREKQAKENEIATLKQEGKLANLRAMIEGQEIERQRVAKDLHDGLGGLLTTVRAHVGQLTEGKTEKNPALALLERASRDVRRIAHNMMPSQLAEAGLSASLEDLAGQLKIQGFDCELEVMGQPEEMLDKQQQHVMLRIAQELTHNVTKHAQAKSIFIQMLKLEERMLLTVEDDGKGFSFNHIQQRGGGLGLKSIEQRVDYLNGNLAIDSQRGKGTTVIVTVPLDSKINPGKKLTTIS